jgi:hypothetical protein
MFVSTNLSVRAMDMTSLFTNGELPTRFYKHKMDIQHGYHITRFQDMVYVLSKSMDIPKEAVRSGDEEWWERLIIQEKHVHEIFLTDIEFSSWDEEFAHEKIDNYAPTMMIQDGRSESRYIYNRRFQTDNNAQNIQADENYIYAFGKDKIIYAERGISSKWHRANFGITKFWSAQGVLGGVKLVIDGHPFALAITKGAIITFKPHVSRPMITCPVPDSDSDAEDSLFGEYQFSMNTTTRSCPEKVKKYPSGIERFQTTCLFMKTFDIQFVEPWIGKGWGASKTRKYAMY